jgi:hypothetical protein
MANYRLTPAEYLHHLEGHEDPEPESTMLSVREAPQLRGIEDGYGSVVAYDAGEGFYWVRTDDLRVPNWNGVKSCTPSDSPPPSRTTT